MIYVISNATKVVRTHEKSKFLPLTDPFYNIIYDLTTFFKNNSCNSNGWHTFIIYSITDCDIA